MINNKKQKRFFITIFSFLVVACGVMIVLQNFNNNIIFFYSPSDLQQVHIPSNKIIRVGGMVKKGSLKIKQLDVQFIVTDFKNDIFVKYNGPLPTLFGENQGTVIKGKLIDNYIEAQQILAKHDENYMPKEVVNSIKKTGQWRGI